VIKPKITPANQPLSEAKRKLGCTDSNWTDNFSRQLTELFLVNHPQLMGTTKFKSKQDAFIQARLSSKTDQAGNYIYYPWSNILLRVLMESELNQLRTNRNQLLISAQEQQKLLNSSVTVLGLSIGSVIARNLVQSGIGKRVVIADGDRFDLTNLNRVPEGLAVIGQKKAEICAQRLYEINPYLSIEKYSEGISQEILPQLFSEKELPQLIIEETDDFVLKIKVRRMARSHKIPVIMATCLGDSVLIDIERFDLDNQTPIFHGKISEEELSKVESGSITEEDKKRLAILLVGKQYVPAKAIESVQEIGKTLVGRPQLFSSVSVAAGSLTFVAREILLGNQLKSQRTLLPFAQSLSE